MASLPASSSQGRRRAGLHSVQEEQENRVKTRGCGSWTPHSINPVLARMVGRGFKHPWPFTHRLCAARAVKSLFGKTLCWQVQCVLAARSPWGCPRPFQLSLGIPACTCSQRGSGAAVPEELRVAAAGLRVCPGFPTACPLPAIIENHHQNKGGG